MLQRTDNTKKYIVQTVLKNNRLDMYKYYINSAINNGYELLPVVEFYERRNEPGKHLVLRHDVDYKSISTRKMFEAEKKLGVRSTYYFRQSTYDEKLVREMEECGFEVGFHYETIADYIKENNPEAIEQTDIEKCKERLKQEISDNKKKYNLKSICSHGAPENTRLNISNNVLVENANYEDFGIILEAYDKEMYEHVNVHIMDENIRHGCGFAYKDNPIDAINNQSRNIVFLAHPNHWYATASQKLRDCIALLAGKYYLESDRVFKRIAGANEYNNM